MSASILKLESIFPHEYLEKRRPDRLMTLSEINPSMLISVF